MEFSVAGGIWWSFLSKGLAGQLLFRSGESRKGSDILNEYIPCRGSGLIYLLRGVLRVIRNNLENLCGEYLHIQAGVTLSWVGAGVQMLVLYQTYKDLMSSLVHLE